MGNRNSGPRPKPTALHVLRGNPSRKNLNINEPLPPSGEIQKPDTLSVLGEDVWDEVAPICLHMRTLTPADVHAFTSFCELQATFTATARKKNMGEFSLKDAKLERDTATALRPYYEFFGLTPSSRARLAVPKKAEEPVSKWAGGLQ